ncbi:MAG: DinB family protein [Chloroflexi bacterium]|nr:DinB family protein [Chloroflexota bacterium]
MLDEQLLDTWTIHHRITLYLLDAITPEALNAAPDKGRSVGQMLAHLHNNRLTWLEAAAPDLLQGLSKIPAKKKDTFEKDTLRAALEASAQVMEMLFRRGFETGKIKNMKPHAAGGFGYFLAHEWYHIGEIGMTLAQVGYPLPDAVGYGLWEWGKR